MVKTRGRPRDPSRDRAILDAARTAFAGSGYTGASMEEIAKLAQVGKDTLYRRWATKESLALDLIDTLAREAVRPAAIDPDPRLNLLLFVKDIVRLYHETYFGALLAGMVGEAARNADFSERFTDFWTRRRAIAAPLVRDVLGVAATEDAIEESLDRVLGPIYYRLLLTGAEVTDEYIWNLVISVPRAAKSDLDAWSESGAPTNHDGDDVAYLSQ